MDEAYIIHKVAHECTTHRSTQCVHGMHTLHTSNSLLSSPLSLSLSIHTVVRVVDISYKRQGTKLEVNFILLTAPTKRHHIEQQTYCARSGHVRRIVGLIAIASDCIAFIPQFLTDVNTCGISFPQKLLCTHSHNNDKC